MPEPLKVIGTQGGIYGVIQRGGTCQEVWVCGAGGALRPRARPTASRGEGAGRGSPPPAKGVRGYNPRKIFEILYAKSCIQRHIQTNKLIRQDCRDGEKLHCKMEINILNF
jgi:hypothetical protein